MLVVVEVDGFDHGCCGPSYERDQVVALTCLRSTTPDGRSGVVETLVEARHLDDPDVVVRGRTTDIRVRRPSGRTEPIQRLPSGRALRGCDPDDDGRLEQAWTGTPLPPGDEFLLTVQVADGDLLPDAAKAPARGPGGQPRRPRRPRRESERR